MEIDDFVFVVLLLAVIFIGYQDVAYMAHEYGSTQIADRIYRDSSENGTKLVPINYRK